MSRNHLLPFALVLIMGCSDGQSPKADQQVETQIAAESRALSATVSGFGGPGGRRGRTDVYLRSGELTGVIRGVLAEELDCKIGDRVPVRQSGNAVIALPGACTRRAPAVRD